MKIIRNIVLNDLTIFVSRTGNLVGLIVLPIIFTLVLGWAFSSGGSAGPQRVRVDVLNQDRGSRSEALLRYVREVNETLVLCPMDNDAEDYCRLQSAELTRELGLERAKAERSAAFLIIPSNYSHALDNFERAEIELYAAGDPLTPNPVEQTVTAVLQKINSASLTAGAIEAVINRFGDQSGLQPIMEPIAKELVDSIYADAATAIETRGDMIKYVTTSEIEEASPGEGFGQSVPGMGTMYVMFTVLAATSVLLRERNQWTLQRLSVMPIARWQILGGKIATYFILGMIQYLIVFGVGIFVGLDFGSRPLLLLPVMIAFVLCITALAFAIAPWMRSQDQASGVARLLALAFAPLGGAWWPLEIVPDFMETIGHLSPVAWAMDGFHDIMWYNGGLVDILPEIAVLLGAATVLFAFTVQRLRVA